VKAYEAKRLEIIAAARALRPAFLTCQAVEDERDLQHVRLMSYVLREGADDVLVDDIVWAYRQGIREGSTGQVLRSWLENWRDGVSEVLGAEGEPVAMAYTQLLQRHAEFMSQAQVRRAPVTVEALTDDLSLKKDQFLLALVHHDGLTCRRLARNHVRDLASYVAFCLDVVQPSLYDIGRLWEAGSLSAADEHAASVITRRALLGLRLDKSSPLAHVGDPHGDGSSREAGLHPGPILLACPEGERHGLGLQMVADALAVQESAVLLLGEDTPRASVLEILHREQPFLLGLSVAMASNLGGLKDVIDSVHSECGAQRPRVLVGGWAMRNRPLLWRELGADAFAADVGEALRVVAKLRATSRLSPSD
jgi:methanogenic corrinoid protein MtbC1